MSISDYSRGDLIKGGLISLLWDAGPELPLVLQQSRCHIPDNAALLQSLTGRPGRRDEIYWLVA